MKSSDLLRTEILAKLSKVIDPETGVDVVRMRLIQDLAVDEQGGVSYKFRPTSFLCPIAMPLSLDIHYAVAEVDGVTGQSVEVVDFALAEQLNQWLRQAFEKQ